jgi:hypothetical protein
MTLQLHDDSISSDHTAHTARLAPGGEHAWEVSWLPGRRMDGCSAITAMVLADAAGSGAPDRDPRLGRYVDAWAASLGLTTPDALARISRPPESRSSEKDAGLAGREAGQ